MKLNELQAKQIEVSGKIEVAETRLTDANTAHTHGIITNGDTSRLSANVIAAQADLKGLMQAADRLDVMVREAEGEALINLMEDRAGKITRKSKRYHTHLKKADEYIDLMLAELADADAHLIDIQRLSELPTLGQTPEGWTRLKTDIRNANHPVAIAIAAKIGQRNPLFAELLGRSLSEHRTASQQAAGRGIIEMAFQPSGYITG